MPKPNWKNNQGRKQPPITEGRRQQPLKKEPAKKQLVLCFERRVDSLQASDWIQAYNKLHTSHSLMLHDTLIHSLHIVIVVSAAPSLTIAKLLRESPLKAAGIHAAVNLYSFDFNPKCPIDFCQLVSISITEGSLFIYL
jgi:hypothetical protein